MSGTRRTIRVTLTEAQYRALREAIAIWDAEYLEGMRDHQTREALFNGWEKIMRAWHSRARRSG